MFNSAKQIDNTQQKERNMNTKITTIILATALAIPLTVMAKEPGIRKEQNKVYR